MDDDSENKVVIHFKHHRQNNRNACTNNISLDTVISNKSTTQTTHNYEVFKSGVIRKIHITNDVTTIIAFHKYIGTKRYSY